VIGLTSASAVHSLWRTFVVRKRPLRLRVERDSNRTRWLKRRAENRPCTGHQSHDALRARSRHDVVKDEHLGRYTRGGCARLLQSRKLWPITSTTVGDIDMCLHGLAWAAGATGSKPASSTPRKRYDENVYTLLFRNGSSNKLHDSVLWESCQDLVVEASVLITTNQA
jgi:hypothetical protein